MSNTKTHLRNLSLGMVVAALFIGTLQAQVTLDPAWRVTPDTTKPGFQWRYFQNNANRPNTDSRTETALAGQLTDGTGALLPNLGDPTAVGAAIAEAAPADPANGSLYFVITNVINLDKTGSGNNGYFPGDELEPGTTAGNTDGQNAEILTFLTLPAGTNYMILPADDSTKVQSGPNPQDVFGRVTLGVRDGGAGEQHVSFVVPAGGAGTYPFRVLWANGGGGSHVEWISTDPDFASNKKLINDTANGGIPAYRAAIGAVKPYVQATAPFAVSRQTESAFGSVTVVLGDGTTPVNTNNITLSVDGTPATLSVSKIGTLVTVNTGIIPGVHLPGEAHTAVLTFKDTGTYSRTQQWTFYNLENLILPARPVTGENFDSYPEATSLATTVPPGWTVTNYTWLEVNPPAGFGTWDLTDVANDPFVNWVMLGTATVLPLEKEVLDNYKAQTINGIALTDTNWMAGNLLFAASDGRARRVAIGGVNQPNDYAPQIQITVSAPFNLSSVTNPVLTFSSGSRLSGNHEQNSLEYSVDNGTNWQAALIMQNSATHFLNADGTFDAVKMLTNAWADVAKFPVVQDPSTRDFISAGPLGQKFGDVLKTPISSALAPFVVERNDGAQSRKVEAIRLPAASKKSQVRLRFTHYGSCGWEWGIDNIAFYDIAPPPSAAPKNIAFVSFHSGDNTPSAAAATAGFTKAPDVGYTDLLKANGYNVTRFLSADDANLSTLSSADLVIISRSVASAHYQQTNETAAWNGLNKPTIILGGYVLRNSRLGYTTGATMVDSAGTVRLTVNNPSHPIFTGVALDSAKLMVNPYAHIVTFTNAPQLGISVNTDAVAGGGTVLAVNAAVGGANGGMVIGEWPAGAKMGDATADILGGRRLVVLTGSRENGITGDGAGIYDLDPDGAKLFLNSVAYMLAPPTTGPTISVSRNSSGAPVITYTGTLESATSVTGGIWSAVAGAISPYTAPTTDPARFYRSRQ